LAFPVPHHPVDFAFGVMFGGRLPFVVEIFAAGQSQFDLGHAMREIDFKRYQSETFFSGLAKKPHDLCLVHQEFAIAPRLVVEPVALLIGADMGADQEEFLVFNFRIRVGQIGPPAPQRFDLGAGQHDTGFKRFMDMVIMPGPSVFGDDLYAFWFFRHWGSPLIFFFGLNLLL